MGTQLLEKGALDYFLGGCQAECLWFSDCSYYLCFSPQLGREPLDAGSTPYTFPKLVALSTSVSIMLVCSQEGCLVH